MATGSRRMGVIGIVSIVLIAASGVLILVNVTSRAQPPRRCAGGLARPAAVSAGDPVDAIRQYAPRASAPAYIGDVVPELPDDGWVRRSDTLFEHAADGGRLLQLDIASADGRATVVGLWLCAPLTS